jgi:hypothetical protein
MSAGDIWLVYYSLDGSGGSGDFVLEDAGWFRSEPAARRWIEAAGETGNYWPERIKRGTDPGPTSRASEGPNQRQERDRG